MTKREYLDECMEVWKWGERHPTASVADKEQAWPQYFFGCPACQYVNDHTSCIPGKPISSCSKVCLIKWTEDSDPRGCEAPSSPYAKWREAGWSNDVEGNKLKYSRQVQDLIRDATRKLDEEEPVAHEGRVFAEDLIVGKEYLRFYLRCKEPERFTYEGPAGPGYFQERADNISYGYSLFQAGLIPHKFTRKWCPGAYVIEAEEELTNHCLEIHIPKPGTIRFHNAKVEWKQRVFKDDLISGEEYLRFYSKCKEPERFTFLNEDFNSTGSYFISREASGNYRRRAYADCGLASYENPTFWHQSAYTVKAENSNYNTDGAKYKEPERFTYEGLEEKVFRAAIEQFRLKDKQESVKYIAARQATVDDYRKWLKGYILNGGSPTYAYKYKLPKRFYVATEDFETFSLYGSQSINIIVPKGIKFLGGELGHCNIFFMEDYTHLGNFVPIYADV